MTILPPLAIQYLRVLVPWTCPEEQYRAVMAINALVLVRYEPRPYPFMPPYECFSTLANLIYLVSSRIIGPTIMFWPDVAPTCDSEERMINNNSLASASPDGHTPNKPNKTFVDARITLFVVATLRVDKCPIHPAHPDGSIV